MRFSGVATTLKKTPLFDWHVARNAQMVPFAGWSMPLQYKGMGQVEAHHHVRNQAGLFDVSHMQQIVIRQPKQSHFMHSILPLSYAQPTNTSAYSVILNETGGIIDDCIATKWSDDSYYLVTNASRADAVREWLQRHQHKYQENTDTAVDISYLETHNQALLALQGPQAAAVLASHSETSLTSLFFGGVAQDLRLSGGAVVHLARSGYTGEDGFEISVERRDAVAVADLLANTTPTVPIGLGARDSLRLEAGMCLYGNDLWEDGLSVGEAGLAWTIAKDRRVKDQPTLFPGWQSVVPSLKLSAMAKRRVGLLIEKGPAARSAAKILDETENVIGSVSSGAPSPTLSQNIAMGYVPPQSAKVGTQLAVDVRGRRRQAEVVKMPFVESKYYRGI
ncbi:hypothetical protein E3P99_03655 [Wallemia hederae]|uniref:Aminomethyltransferase n=1 Tax=Wallemia hederae TaxID=1540922 RepID=A0A4T0FEA2_9BASI|nr:hypothetical protein E3P99_03655 [Wallemia hederae]